MVPDGISPSMAMISETALIWPAMLPLVSSWLRLASSQSRARIWSRPRFRLRSPSASWLISFSLTAARLLDHVGADAGLGSGIGGGVGIEADSFRSAAVIHGSGQNQVSKGHFLIGDGIGDRVFGHSGSLSRLQEMGRAVVSHPSQKAAKNGAPEILFVG